MGVTVTAANQAPLCYDICVVVLEDLETQWSLKFVNDFLQNTIDRINKRIDQKETEAWDLNGEAHSAQKKADNRKAVVSSSAVT